MTTGLERSRGGSRAHVLTLRYAAQYGVNFRQVARLGGGAHLARMTPLARRVLFGAAGWKSADRRTGVNHRVGPMAALMDYWKAEA